MPDRWVHCTFCRQTYLAGQGEKCDLCGKIGGLVDPKAADLAAFTAPDLRRETALGDRARGGKGTATAIGAWGVAKLAFAGLSFVVSGFWLMLAPGVRADPKAGLTWGILGLSGSVVALGLLFLFLAGATVWRWINET